MLLLVPGSAFHHFLNFSDWLWQTTGKTHEFAYEKLVDLMHAHLTEARGLQNDAVCAALLADYQASGARGRPQCLAQLLSHTSVAPSAANTRRNERQVRHTAQA